MGQGYVADTNALAIRVGELRAVASEVESAALGLDISSGDLGPGEISAAVNEVVEQWRSGLEEMRGKIDTIADNVRGSVSNYEAVEQASEDRMRALADGNVAQGLIEELRQYSPEYQQQRAEALARLNQAKLHYLGD
jgi:hypothetical protein